METTPVAEYILELCEKRNMSMREASLAAGLGTETISVIVRRGPTITPRPETLKALAEGLDGSYLRMLKLAGYIPDNFPVEVPESMQGTLEHLAELWSEIGELDPTGRGQARLEAIAIEQAEMVLAALRVVRRTQKEEAPQLQE